MAVPFANMTPPVLISVSSSFTRGPKELSHTSWQHKYSQSSLVIDIAETQSLKDDHL